MSTLAINSLNQGFYGNSTNPSGAYITRRARLARVFVVASLALLLLAAIANRAGGWRIDLAYCWCFYLCHSNGCPWRYFVVAICGHG